MGFVTKTPIAAANDSAFGTVAWLDQAPPNSLLDKVVADDGSNASPAGGVPGGQGTKGLSVAFDLSADGLPTDGDVSVTVTVRKRKAGGSVNLQDSAARFIVGGVPLSIDLSHTGNWPSVETGATYSATLPAADVAGVGFGFVLAVRTVGASPDPDIPASATPVVDQVSLTASW